jgi:hypothetical protein
MTESPSVTSFCSESRSDATILSMEDFDNGVLNGWTGVPYPVEECFDATCIIFAEGDRPKKTVKLPSGTMNIHVEFVFYEMGFWDGDDSIDGPDKFLIRVNDKLVDLGTFLQDFPDANQGYVGGIRWKYQSFFDVVFLGAHNVVLDIPEKYLSSGTLTITFQTSMTNFPANEFGGLDDLKIVACSS